MQKSAASLGIAILESLHHHQERKTTCHKQIVLMFSERIACDNEETPRKPGSLRNRTRIGGVK